MNQTYPLPGFAAALMVAALALVPAGIAGPLQTTAIPMVEGACSDAAGLPPADIACPEALDALDTIDGVLDTGLATIEDICAGASTPSTAVADCATSVLADVCPGLSSSPTALAGCVLAIIPLTSVLDTASAQAEAALLLATTAAEGAAGMAADGAGLATVNNPLVGPIVALDQTVEAYAGFPAQISGNVDRGVLGSVIRDNDEDGQLDITFSVVVDGAAISPTINFDDESGDFSFVHIAVEEGPHTFEVTADYADAQLAQVLSGEDQVVVDYLDDGAAVDLKIVVDEVATQLNSVAFNPGYPAHVVGLGATIKTLSVELQDDNGVQDLTGTLSTSVQVPGGQSFALASAGQSDRTQGAADPVASIRTVNYGVSFPDRLKAGFYTFEAAYEALDTAPAVVEVLNVAPTLGTTSAVLTMNTGKATPISGTVSVVADDLNFGKLPVSNVPVSELQALLFTVTPTDTVAVDDVRVFVNGVQVPLAAGVGVFTLSSDVSMAAITKSIRVSYDQAFGAAPSEAGAFAVTLNVDDLQGLTATPIQIAAIVIQPFEAGFGLEVLAGGDGVNLANVKPGETTDNRADPLNVRVTKRQTLGQLQFEVPDFSNGNGRSIEADGMAVKICLAATSASDCIAGLGGVALTGTIANGIATIPVTGSFGDSGTSLKAYFVVNVPTGTAAGAYSSAMTVLGASA